MSKNKGKEVRSREKKAETDRDAKEEILDEENIFTRSILHRRVYINITQVGANLERNLKKSLIQLCEGKCIEEGYIKPESIKLLTHSSGVAYAENICFDVAFECKLCYPTEGMRLQCFAKNITKAGIRAEIYEDRSLNMSTPMMIFIARDHHYNGNDINDIVIGQKITVRVLGTRFELNDTFISIIAEYVL